MAFGGLGKAKVANSGRYRTVFAASVLRISICGPQIFDTHPTYGTRRNFSDTYERFPKLNFTKNRETRNHLHKIAEFITAGRHELSDRSFTERKCCHMAGTNAGSHPAAFAYDSEPCGAPSGGETAIFGGRYRCQDAPCVASPGHQARLTDPFCPPKVQAGRPGTPPGPCGYTNVLATHK